MPGFSLTLLLLPKPSDNAPKTNAAILNLLDYSADAPGWKWISNTPPAVVESTTERLQTTGLATSICMVKAQSAKMNPFIKAACQRLIDAEPEITRLDSIAGDGDCGLTLKAGAEGELLCRHGRPEPNNQINQSCIGGGTKGIH
jgi:dihydroxyacetone kinase